MAIAKLDRKTSHRFFVSMTESERMEEANEDSALLSTPKKLEAPSGPQCRLPAHTVVLGLLAVVGGKGN